MNGQDLLSTRNVKDKDLGLEDTKLVKISRSKIGYFSAITLPLILPGVISGGLFAFVTSFDEVVVVLFLAGLENTTIPIQMWTGLREQLSPTILAVATCLIILSTLILVTAELLRRRSERLRGINR